MADTNIEVCEGQRLHLTVPDSAKNEQDTQSGQIKIKFNQQKSPQQKSPLGFDCNTDHFYLTEKLLSQHLMLLGGIGSGKTNTFNHILSNIHLSQSDVMIIFDTKGDFYKAFYRPGDIVISNDHTATGPDGPDYWNIIKEYEDSDQVTEDIIEICNALFAEKLKKNTSNSFFPMAAKDLMTAILYYFSMNNRTEIAHNAILAKTLKNEDVSWYRDILRQIEGFSAMESYIPENADGQTQGVVAELQQIIRSLFVGNFAKKGNLSIRDLVRQKGGKRIFIEYDIGIGSMLSPIYTLLFDLAIKEALCRDKSEGNVFFVCDEFKLLPNLQHIDDAVNFGRSLGIKFMIGVQNVEQIIEIYGEHMAKNIFSGFLNLFAFKVSDHTSRTYVKERAGENRKITVCKTASAVQTTIDKAYVIEDWDISNLEVGEAIVMLNGSEPFKFHFEEYTSEDKKDKEDLWV